MCAAACLRAADGDAKKPENLNSVAWVQTSAEYTAGATQTYRTARLALLQALQDKQWTAALEQAGDFQNKPPAVILDLDETVLDNSGFEAQIVTGKVERYTTESWGRWVGEKRAGVVPGAVEFLKFAHARGVALFYVTNRICNAGDEKDPTVQTLLAVGVPLPSPDRLKCKSDVDEKGPRRSTIAATHRILLLLGDDLNDFLTVPAGQGTVEGRQRIVRANEQFWGERWFIVPNPTYGSWERTIGYSVPEKVKAIRE